MKNLLSVLLIIAISACSTTKVLEHKTPISTIAPPAIQVPIATLGSSVLKENITFKCSNCTALESQRILNAQHMLNAEIKTQCFHDSFTDPKSPELVQTNGYTPEQVVSVIRSFISQDIPIKMYYTRNDVEGYTYDADPTLYLNRYFRTDADYDDGDWSDNYEASNETHEATHKMDFIHDFKLTARRPNSVPYRANKAIELCQNKR